MESSPVRHAPRQRGRITRLASAVAHAAVFAGLYVTASVVCLAQLAGLDRGVSPEFKFVAAAFAFCTATGVYLLDRVKLRDAWLDPADAHAHPRRFAFIARHAIAVRTAMGVLLICAGFLGARVLEWGAVIPIAAAAGVLLYAGRPRTARPRPKDVVILKNLYVALGITGFAAVVALAAFRPRADLAALTRASILHEAPLAISCAHLAVRVLADAVVCDVDDEDADRRFGTGTLPVHMGRHRAWKTAMALRIAAAVAIACIPALPLIPRITWAAVTVVSSTALRLAAPTRLRDWVDARFAIEAAAVTAVLSITRSR